MKTATSFQRACALGLVLLLPLQGFVHAAEVKLANQPVFSSSGVPGNLALALSVEWPTASRMAHTAEYSNTTNFLGYFDPDKCYDYIQNTASNTTQGGVTVEVGKGDLSYFQPAGKATNRTCSGKWSGNFLNWASTAAIDPFRWAMTGGRRVVDTASETILEKGWHSGQGLFPGRNLPAGFVAGATTYGAGSVGIEVNGRGFAMRLTNGASTTDYTMRVKVCDPSATAGGVESNCKQYGGNWKPEGLVQKYSQDMRYSAFGYLNESGNQRDGAVLRARQAFVGPLEPVPGKAPKANAAMEWDASTGVFVRNPQSTDATATNQSGVTISDSGVINYLNKFGQLYPGNYKDNDPVSELYYTALRYYRNLGDVPEWSNVNSTDTATVRKRLDGFPVIRTWDDPVQHSCQRNFVLGIGDIYTHADKNVPGNTNTADEPTLPPAVATDTTVDAVAATNRVGVLQGMGSDYGTRTNISSGCCSNNSGRMAGLAFDANTKDIRPDVAGKENTIGKQTVQTYWVDVLEQPFVANNQFYLAAKFGGMKVPANFDPYSYSAAIPDDWWWTTGETVGTGGSQQKRPDNYFTAGRPDTMVAGLTKAFESIVGEIKAYTTSFSLSTKQVSEAGNASYASQYDSKDWSGEFTATEIKFSTDGTPSTAIKPSWSSTTTLGAQFGGTGWDSNRRVVTMSAGKGIPFRAGSLSAAQMAKLDTSYVGTDDSAAYLNYLRGDKTNEAKGYRARAVPLGDIVNSKVTPVGPPSALYSETVNPGYADFKKNNATRPTIVYVGANDGMLHAFRGGLTGTDAGKELFAYVPSTLFDKDPSDTTATSDGLLAQLGRPTYAHRNFVDATALSFDIDFNYAGGTLTTKVDKDGKNNSNWRTVLIGGLGKGGKTYYALDVTDPAAMTSEAAVAGKVLWEFTDADMGYTFGNPVVVKTKKYGWVVVLSSGYNNVDGKGYLFFVNPTNGALLAKVATPGASSGLAHPTAYVRDYTDFTADAVYAGDLDGKLWRFDVTGSPSSYPVPKHLATLTDGTTVQPVTSQPLVEIHPRLRKRFVMVGTGRLLDPSDITNPQMQSFYAIVDGGINDFDRDNLAWDGAGFPATRARLAQATVKAGTGGAPDTIEPVDTTGKAGWYLNLGITSTVGWRSITGATAYSNIAAFATTLPTGDACSPGGLSRIYALDFGTAGSKLDNKQAFVGLDNVATDLSFFSMKGKVGQPKLIAGDSRGNIIKVPVAMPPTSRPPLLNWREVPTLD